MDSIQIRALRNGLVAAVITLAAGFGLNALFTSEPTVSARGHAPTQTPLPLRCRPTFEQLERTLTRGVGGTVLGLAATDQGDAWAVGYTGAPEAASLTSIARWNGRAWERVKGPDTAIVDVLTDVDAVTGGVAWAAGWSRDAGPPSGLLARWDGKTWAEIAAPRAASGLTLTGVAVVSDDTVWAVGYTGDPEDGAEHAVVVLWDGSSTRTVPVPVGAGRSALHAIDAAGPGDVWAVGYHRNTPLVLRYDGSAWQRVLDVEARGGLASVSVAGPTEAWAVGRSVLRWDGTVWTEVGPLPGNVNATAVSASGPGRAWIVGVAGTDERPRSVVVQATADQLSKPAAVTVPGAETLTSVVAVGDIAWSAGYRETEAAISPVFGRLIGCETPAQT